MAKKSTPIRPNRSLPRGIRNNNPLNIRIGNVWLGEVRVNTDGEFEQFVSMLYGLRAAMVILRRYVCHYKFTTIAQIISHWAPSGENNTVRYIDFVSQLTGVPADEPISFGNSEVICKIVQAMAKMETGHDISYDLIRQAYSLA